MADMTPSRPSLRQRLGFSSRGSIPRGKLTKKNSHGEHYQPLREGVSERRPSEAPSVDSMAASEPDIAPELLNIAPEDRYKLRHHPKTRRFKSGEARKDIIDRNTGERSDLTDILHSLHFDAELEGIEEREMEPTPDIDESRPRGEQILCKLSAELWDRVTDFLEPTDGANLALTCKTVWFLLGRRPFDRLWLPINKQQRIDFLLPMTGKFPNQLFCFSCASFHVRTHPGDESLRPTNVLNPLFVCPNSTNNLITPARMRITVGRTLPFTFVQLVTRAWQFGPDFGIPVDNITRRWKETYSDWSHHTRYHVHRNGHLLMRVVSQVFADGGMTLAAKRMLLYSREDYWPYFSACAHWRDGLLMDLTKCALDHLPVARHRPAVRGGPKAPNSMQIVSLCGNCLPMRRCPQCPTEYLIELKLVEHKDVPMNDPRRFRQALLVTRWTDLGPGISPMDREWAAVQGEYDGYDSIAEAGNRSVSSTFESAFSDTFPYQRMLNLNPGGERKGESGNSWY